MAESREAVASEAAAVSPVPRNFLRLMEDGFMMLDLVKFK
jgi:hypothetical protein